MIGGKLWNIAYSSRENRINPKFIKYTNSGNISPYMELNFENLNYINFKDNELNIIEVNPYFRYFEIFFRMINVNENHYKETKEILFNCICHLLAEIEIKKGLTMEDYYLSFIKKDIDHGKFGKTLGIDFNKTFNERERNKLYQVILNLYRDGNMIEHFCESISKIFKNSMIYNCKNQNENLLIYLTNKETNINKEKVRILEQLFLPLGIKTKVFWEYPFLIIGNDDASIIEECQIF